MLKLPRRAALLGVLALGLASLAACGKKGEPEAPPGQPKNFPKSYPPKGT